jgi:hypothetical protein
MKGKTEERSARKDGGSANGEKPDTGVKKIKSYTSSNNVESEAEESGDEWHRKGRKKGGKVGLFGRGKESEGAKLADEKKLKRKDGGSCDGMAAHARADKKPRKGRATGGSALSTAENTSARPGFAGNGSMVS